MRVVLHSDFFFTPFSRFPHSPLVITRAHLLRSVFTKSRYYCIFFPEMFSARLVLVGVFICLFIYFFFYVLSTRTIYTMVQAPQAFFQKEYYYL